MKSYKIKVNGKVYMVEVEEVTGGESAAPVAPVAPAAPVAGAGDLKIESPMQGLIMSVKTRVGTEVKKGQIVAILEAMKLENEIACPFNGIVASISAKEGQVVDSGDLLMTIETK